MSDCPVKIAAKDAPNAPAIISSKTILTYSQFDTYIDRIEVRQVETAPTIEFIATLFATWRRGGSFFPTNPKIPTAPPKIGEVPPESLLLRTSGSTGTPKIAILSKQSLIANANGAIHALDLKPGDHWRLTLPLYHVGGIGIILRCILARATIVLDDDEKVTHLSYVPTHLYRTTPVYKHLRCLLLGGAPTHKVPPNLPIYTSYGLTEMGSLVSLDGITLSNRELMLAADGEVLVKGATLFTQYLGEPIQEGWFATKDVGKWMNGKLSIIGRKDWMFISGGENIQPEEIERELTSLNGVLEAVVVAKDDLEFGKRPVAVVKAEKPFSFKEMEHKLLDRLPKYKIPIELHFWDEIPKKDNFKINRFIVSQLINNK